MESSIDHSISPCDDFYYHTCGNYQKALLKQGIQSYFDEILQYNMRLYLDAFEDDAAAALQTSKSQAVRKVIGFYKQCTKDLKDEKTQNELKRQMTEPWLDVEDPKIKCIEECLMPNENAMNRIFLDQYILKYGKN